MRILIADDESLARSTLRSMLQEVQSPLELLEDATNGEELVELVRLHSPHIVFVDIKMPKLNGLEAIKHARQFAPHTRWFILTGFSEFSYAQESLHLGVSDYLLKPVDPAELKNIVHTVQQEQRKRLLALNTQFEQDIASTYHGLSPLPQEKRNSFLRTAHFVGSIFYLDSFLPKTEKAQRLGVFFQHVQAIIHNLLTLDLRIALFALPGGEIALISAWEAEHAAESERLSSTCLYQIEQLLSRYHVPGFCITMLQTPLCPSYDTLSEKLNWLVKFSHLRSLYGIGKKLRMQELEPFIAQPRHLEVSQLLNKLSHSYREKMYLQYMHTLDQLLATLFQDIDYGTKKCLASFLCQTLPCELSAEQPLSTWKADLQACGEALLLAPAKKDNRDLISQVLSFVEKNYASDIGIAQIADMLHVTPNYLSALFHKRVGTTFLKYLTRIRLLKARELLADPELQVQQVAEQVGYYSVRHFTRLFTAFFGYYPSERR